MTFEVFTASDGMPGIRYKPDVTWPAPYPLARRFAVDSLTGWIFPHWYLGCSCSHCDYGRRLYAVGKKVWSPPRWPAPYPLARRFAVDSLTGWIFPHWYLGCSCSHCDYGRRLYAVGNKVWSPPR